MNHKQEFEDLSKGELISYDHFLYYLEQGREIEFVYKGKEYFIAHTVKGRSVWDGQRKISECFGECHQDILQQTKIDGVLLADVIKRYKIEISTVF